ncbi:MAG: hypothetical protein ISP73_05515 [Flavobacteriales bacterium]|nr:hypothetical protein [Flavobacteriales bacterium]
MKDIVSFNYSIRFRIVFSLLTFGFLLAFLLSKQSLIMLMIFLNMVYINVMYFNTPALSIADGKIHQHSFNSTTLFIENLEEIIDEDKTITLLTSDDKMIVNKFLFDEKSRLKLEEFCEKILVK